MPIILNSSFLMDSTSSRREEASTPTQFQTPSKGVHMYYCNGLWFDTTGNRTRDCPYSTTELPSHFLDYLSDLDIGRETDKAARHAQLGNSHQLRYEEIEKHT